ncbi:hypothetical protein CEXT_430501 [Caerostris extrusa]|uniref:Uncharacterized protein n=1 Tax=Caerostris extrusa TaxID=172846 RepID=A0AAV4XMM6_CAEEX|nr:hypothetical protein CEXT_430501 [Caerostris extrusa]
MTWMQLLRSCLIHFAADTAGMLGYLGEDPFLPSPLGTIHYAGAGQRDTRTREQSSPCIWRKRRQSNKRGSPNFIWETRGAVDSPKFSGEPSGKKEDLESIRCSVGENKEQPVAGRGAVREAQCVHRKI